MAIAPLLALLVLPPTGEIETSSNTQRLICQSHLNLGNTTNLPSARDLLRPSAYTSRNVINENLTIPIPTFVRTGDTYFQQRQLHLTSMLQQIALPTLFITLSMVESRWT